MTPVGLALVALGGALGSVVRYAAGVWLLGALGASFPWGTLAVNVVGSAVIGVIGGLAAAGTVTSNELRLFVVTGVLGGFTTFSAFSLDTGTLFGRSPALAALYVGVTVAGGLASFAAGFWAGRAVA
ncbi:fluoride efflux transporter CrcB [Roseomonas sp. CCTCC AB2023176]|uniref:fluoride efflux transporter CrcB n=1 Tax=Roseomonas sp. CCTCC AB2023176 TaxID=3342640 RepID=UPI0035DA848C